MIASADGLERAADSYWSAPITPVVRKPARDPRFVEKTARGVAVALNEICGSCQRTGFGILMYHRVIDTVPGQPRPTWNVTPAQFEEQLSGLLKRGYDPWPLHRVLEHHEKQWTIPRRVFVVTFDDGYQNNFTRAFPILQKLRVPATIFLATRYLDSDENFPNDDWLLSGSAEASPEAWRPMTTDECRQLQKSGLVELGAHTHSHDDYRGRPDYFRADLQHCCEVLREKFGIERPTFAFPYGTKNNGFAGPDLVQAARETDVCCSLTTEAEIITAQTDPFDWGRLVAEDIDTSTTLAAKLGGWISAARKVKHFIKGLRGGKKSTGDDNSDSTPERSSAAD
ncbi:Poly-beta-1,6-N-acetyl-D-glucosamine N-deacetylase precursor [Anatilimnocola aggregata]|uniref:Poly-beta-1,6-N-acetyl-D-glucosamine N-deacetylase n=2 Tax=Anatilimnocola aggregata TaxID=2528021 RepID=A0A517YAS6_9BACT|nr:Poly-beta-1,6-N-acetyl-D-glucosamine N-deacetylase precursor [Anatilimnocola aggregata]